MTRRFSAVDRGNNGGSVLHRPLRSAAWLIFALAAAARPSVATADPPDEAPYVWHARLMYHARNVSPALGRNYDVLVFAVAEMPVRCQQDDGHPSCEEHGHVTSSGHVYATGHALVRVDDKSIEENYDQGLHWSTTAPGTDSAVSLGPATPSKVGPGISSLITVHGTLTGVAQTVYTGTAQGTVRTNEVSLARPELTRRGPGDEERFGLSLTFDPNPGPSWMTVNDGAPEAARRLINLPNGEYVAASPGNIGMLFGASTEVGPGGRHSQCLVRMLQSQNPDDGLPTIEVHYCGWLTRPGDPWTPPRLPPADRATRP